MHKNEAPAREANLATRPGKAASQALLEASATNETEAGRTEETTRTEVDMTKLQNEQQPENRPRLSFLRRRESRVAVMGVRRFSQRGL